MLSTLAHLYIKLFVLRGDMERTFSVHEPGMASLGLLQEIRAFRARNFALQCPYLLDETQARIEVRLALDERSHHVLARRRGDRQIVGCLRLTPAPFELGELTDAFAQVQLECANRLEIGRLVTEPGTRHVGKKIMMLAGIHAVENTSCLGFVGVCKTGKIPYFQKFGMRTVSGETRLLGRPHSYAAITSDFATMRSHVMRNFVSRLTFTTRREAYERVS